MDWLKEVLEFYYPNSTHPHPTQQYQLNSSLSPVKIKPIISSRDILNISAISQRSRLSKFSPKSFRSLSIKQTEGRVLPLQDLKEFSKTLKNNKYLHTLNLQLNDYNSLQLKIFAEKLRKFHRLKSFTIDFLCTSRNHGGQALLSLPKHLQDLTYLKLCFLPEEWRGKKLNFDLKNLKHLTTLYIDVSDEENMKVEDMEIISSNLKTCRYLQNLTLDFEYCDYMRNKAVYNLTSALQNLYSLSKLNLRFKHCYLINHKAAQSLASCFNSLQNITSLTLNFGHCSKINSTAIVTLSKALRELKNLKALDVCFPFGKDAKEGIYIFFQELVHIQTLQFLKFNIPVYSHITSEDLFKKISEALKVQSQLQVLTIKLKGLKIEGVWAKHLAEAFKSLQTLSDLVLNFKSNQSLNDKNAEFLGEGLRELGSLTTLQLNLKNHNFSQEGVRKVLAGIGTTKNLKKMDLVLEKENPKGFFAFSIFNNHSHIKGLTSVLNNLKNLQTLSLDFALRDATDQDFSEFSFQLSTMKQLTTLSLTFNKFKSSVNMEKGLLIILSNLKHLSNLNDLCLKVEYGSNEDLSSIFGSLKDLVKLESLEINFLQLKGFNFDTANQFIEAMEKLEKLHKLNLNIDFENKKAKEVAHFLTGILKLKSLSLLQYYFGSVESALPMGSFLENWRHIKTIRSLIYFDGGDDETL